MTPQEPPETKRSVYDVCDPKYLRELREAAGMDVVVLARTACLSVAQVRQLETDDSDNLFYSDAIKRQAYKRLLMVLGAEPPTAELPDDLRNANKVAQAHLDTLDQIVAMSQQPSMNRSTLDVLREGWIQLKERRQAIGALLFLAGAVVLFVLYGPMSPKQVELVEVTSPAASAPPVIVPAKVEPSPVPTASAPLVAEMVAPASVPLAAAVAASPASAPAPAPSVAPASVVASQAAVVNKAAACAYASEGLPKLNSVFASKDGRYVYFVSPVNVELCVVDGNKQATVLKLKAGEGRSVYGVSPWQVSGTQLQKLQMYFQGGRVMVPDAASQAVELVEVAIPKP